MGSRRRLFANPAITILCKGPLHWIPPTTSARPAVTPSARLAATNRTFPGRLPRVGFLVCQSGFSGWHEQDTKTKLYHCCCHCCCSIGGPVRTMTLLLLFQLVDDEVAIADVIAVWYTADQKFYDCNGWPPSRCINYSRTT